MDSKNKILVLGIGNILLNDEGVGIHIVKYLEQEGLKGVDLLDGGTGGFHLLAYLQSYRQVIVVDASLDNFEAGTLRVLHPKYAKDFPAQLSAHEIGLRDLLDAAFLLGNCPDIHLVAISIKNLQEMGMELTPEVEAVVPFAARKVRELAESLSGG